MLGSGFDLTKRYATINKDPSAVLPYTIDWSPWLEVGDTIVASVWTLPAGTLTMDSESHTTTATQIVLSSGDNNKKYDVENHITTANGLEDSRRITLNVATR